jgi:hypothetical protein
MRDPQPSAGLAVWQELVFDREEDCTGARRDADLVVDVLDVMLGGATRDPETPADFRIRASFGDKSQNLELAIAEPARTEVSMSCGREMARVEDGGNNVWVKSTSARLAEQFISRLRRFEGCAMRAALSHRLKCVRASQDTGCDINVPAPTAPMVAGSIDPLVVHSGDSRHWFQH